MLEFLTMACKTFHNLEPSLTSLTALLCTQFQLLAQNQVLAEQRGLELKSVLS